MEIIIKSKKKMKTAVHKGFFSLRPMLKIPAENLFPAVLVSLSACCD